MLLSLYSSEYAIWTVKKSVKIVNCNLSTLLSHAHIQLKKCNLKFNYSVFAGFLLSLLTNPPALLLSKIFLAYASKLLVND